MVKHLHSLYFSLVVCIILLINTDNTSLVTFVDGFSNRATFGSSTSSRRYQTSYTSLPSTIKLVKANHDRWLLTRPVPLYMSVEEDQNINRSNNSDDMNTPTTTTTEEQLQKRFEEAMKRRKQRGVLKDEGVEMNKLTGINDEEVEKDIRDSNLIVTTNIKSTNQDESTLKSSTIEDEYEVVQPTSKRRPRQPRYDDERFLSSPSSKSSAKSLRTDEVDGDDDYERQYYRRYRTDRYEDEEYSYVSDPDDNQYDDYKYDDERRYRTSRSIPKCEWETYRSTSIVFPPQLLLDESNNKDIPSRPNAIIHFIGGTFFGSYPRKFYGSLLEDIATKCNAVVVATPIPLILPGKGLVNKVEKWMFDEDGIDDDDYGRKRRGDTKATNNPLDHLSLAESIQRNFNNVYRDVVLDEYCTYMNATEVEDFMKDVPIVGIGHSLGARIQAISCSHPSISQRCLSMGKGNRLIRSGRDGMVYLGFANWGASSSIPGVETLDRTVKKRKRGQQREEQQKRRGAGRRDDVWDDRRRPQNSRRRQRRRPRDDDRRRRYNRYDRYEAEDLDLVDVFGDVVQDVVKGAKQIGEALTPETEDLEFTPTPNELWDNISDPDGCYRQSSRSNLIVQFDDDPIDQGSRLARTLLTAYDEVEEDSQSNSTTVKGDDDNSPLPHDVKFARLSGGHLTPVTVREGIAKLLPRGAVSLLSSSYNFILKQLNDERMGKSSQRQKREVKDVANTIASYIESLNGDK